jgi:hypothetical protein
MRYAILIYGDEARVEATPEGMKAMFDEYQGYERWLAGRGIKRGAEALYPTDQATTLRVRDGKVMTIDGPFAETKEQLGGYYLVDVGSIDEALEWAAKIPGSRHGSVEVRPVMVFDEEGGS